MATFNPRRFAQPDKLKEITPDRLLQLFTPYRVYLEGRGFLFAENGRRMDYPRLATILMTPDNTTPMDMVDALYFIHGMATAEGMNQLIEAARENGLSLAYDQASSPADIAIQVWLQDRALLENLHAKELVTHPRSFVYFFSNVKGYKFAMPGEETIQVLESDMDAWFEQHRRGRGCKIFLFDHGNKVSLLIRHGMPTKREGALKEGGEPSSVHFRPEKHDVVVYDRKQNELAVNAVTKGEREMYIAKIGSHLFGSEFYFPSDEKYTLEPLKRDGRAALACGDVEGLEWIRLRILSINKGGRYSAMDVKKATDVFAHLEESGESLHPMTRLVTATFEAKIANIKRSRSVTIRPANNAQYARDEDSDLLEEWMMKRGFIPRAGNGVDDEDAQPIVDNLGTYAGSGLRAGGMAAAPWG